MIYNLVYFAYILAKIYLPSPTVLKRRGGAVARTEPGVPGQEGGPAGRKSVGGAAARKAVPEPPRTTVTRRLSGDGSGSGTSPLHFIRELATDSRNDKKGGVITSRSSSCSYMFPVQASAGRSRYRVWQASAALSPHRWRTGRRAHRARVHDRALR